jgi:hypothetical protein
MNITPLQAKKLLLEDHSFSQLGFSMLLTRLKGLYTQDPSEEALHNSMTEINMFLGKFKGIMKNDCVIISRL